ncbi:DIRAS1 (predicted) [Pycnogonum litorale]
MKENKVVVLGAGGVGKTSLVVQFMEGFFEFTYKPTVEDYYRHIVQMPDGIFHTVEIIDTAGSHHFPAMRELSIRSGKAFVLVFSVDKRQTYNEAIELWKLIQNIRGTDVPVILVGNKADLNDVREVPVELPNSAVAEIQNATYIETSARYNVNVTQLFIELLFRSRDRPVDTADQKRSSVSRRFSRRLSSLGSITAIRRKSSSVSSNNVTPRHSFDKTSSADSKCVIL